MNVLPMLEAFRTWPWLLVAIRSFREHFEDHPLLVIDNNPPPGNPHWHKRCIQEKSWLRARNDIIVIENPGPDYSAGKGIDLGLQYARERGFDAIVHLEPDCLISGKRWWEKLLEPLRSGAWMSGQMQRFYGPIHPTPSAWRTDIAWKSFAATPRNDDVLHPSFEELFKLTTLLQYAEIHEPNAVGYWKSWWDTAQRNWFYAATHDSAVLIEDSGDFTHFWYGSKRPPDPSDPRLQPYLDPSWYANNARVSTSDGTILE